MTTKIDHYEATPVQARLRILSMEQQYNLDVRINETDDYCMICIDKNEKSIKDILLEEEAIKY